MPMPGLKADCEFEVAIPTGAIISVEQVVWQSPIQRKLFSGLYWYDAEDEEDSGPEKVVSDRESTMYEFVTSDGKFYAIAENIDGHGHLSFYKLV